LLSHIRDTTEAEPSSALEEFTLLSETIQKWDADTDDKRSERQFLLDELCIGRRDVQLPTWSGAVTKHGDCNELVRFLKDKGLSAISEVMGIELVHHFGKLQAEDFDDSELSFLKRWQKQELIELVQGIAACSASLCLSAFASASTTTFVLPPTRQVWETTRGDGYGSGRRFREATGRRSGRSRAFISEAMAKAEADGIVQGIRIC
jgi:hypothetical protein